VTAAPYPEMGRNVLVLCCSIAAQTGVTRCVIPGHVGVSSFAQVKAPLSIAGTVCLLVYLDD
jgi:hypothetical protein